MSVKIHVTSVKLDKKNLHLPNHVYIGRKNKSYGLEASPLANPFIFTVMGYLDSSIKAINTVFS